MGWKGTVAGSLLGGFRGGLLGSLLGAVVGHFVEEYLLKHFRVCVSRTNVRCPHPPDSLDGDYAALGVVPTANDAVVKAAYREMAKANHPDSLRAQGASEAEVRRATERMTRINGAWARIKSARGL